VQPNTLHLAKGKAMPETISTMHDLANKLAVAIHRAETRVPPCGTWLEILGAIPAADLAAILGSISEVHGGSTIY